MATRNANRAHTARSHAHRPGKAADSQFGAGAAAVVQIHALKDLDVVQVLPSLSLHDRAHVLAGADDGASGGAPAFPVPCSQA